MDYSSQGLVFKIKKVLRYSRLYGIHRTFVKVQAQRHMKKKYATLPELPSKTQKAAHVGIMGCGNFAYSNIAYYLTKNYGAIIHGAMDIDIHKAASLFERYNLNYYTDDPERIVSDPSIDLVFIASNHASHAEYAIRALDRGKSVHIEKPHVVSEDQLVRLCSAMRRSKGNVGLGFNRPGSRIGQEILGSLNSQEGSAMYNWFVAGHEIEPDHWYFKEEEGGRVLGNLCHWTDFIYQMVPKENRYPVTINPTRWEKSDCDIAVSYTFGDGSIGVITFSAKGHTFEGVRERFAAHRGNVLIAMDDFKNLRIEVVDKKRTITQMFRDHGHEKAIRSSYEMVTPGGRGSSVDYVWETGYLFLKTREALRQKETIVLQPFDPEDLSMPANKPA
jgi:predicted dehydrogenase